jgi:hypothetical protein
LSPTESNIGRQEVYFFRSAVLPSTTVVGDDGAVSCVERRLSVHRLSTY